MDKRLLDDLLAVPLESGEASALVDQYTEGQCMVFAFAVSWMTGWKVEAVSERDGDTWLHFAAVGPDGDIWDAAGPRTREAAAGAYAVEPVWGEVDPYKSLFTYAGATEDDVTEACVAAIRLMGEKLVPHLNRLPTVPDALMPSGPARRRL